MKTTTFSAIIVALSVAFSSARGEAVGQRIKVLDFTQRGILDDRRAVTLIVNGRTIAFADAEQLAGTLFPKEQYNRITICEPGAFHPTWQTHFEVIYALGETGELAKAIASEPLALYVVFPESAPPANGVHVLIGVLLRADSPFSEVNQKWREWCKENNRPCVELKTYSIGAVLDGVARVKATLLELERQRARATLEGSAK